MPGQSLKILIGLVAAAFLLSGWLIGWQWKHEVSHLKRENAELRQQLKGNAFTQEEQILIDLQDQLDISRKENERLNTELRNLSERLEALQAPTAKDE